jgi:hypothetical protein
VTVLQFENSDSFLLPFCSLYALHVRLDQVNSRLGHAVASIQVEDNPPRILSHNTMSFPVKNYACLIQFLFPTASSAPAAAKA